MSIATVKFSTILFGFAQAAGKLDDAVTVLAADWNIVGDVGVELTGFSVPAYDSNVGEVEARLAAAQAGPNRPAARAKAGAGKSQANRAPKNKSGGKAKKRARSKSG